MKHIRVCPTRGDKSKVVFWAVLSICLIGCLTLVILKIEGMEDVEILGCKIKSFIFVSIFFAIIAIILLLAIKNNYCKRELAILAILTKKNLRTIGLLSYKRLKKDNVQKILVWQTWIYNKKEWERCRPKGARPRWAEYTGNNEENFDLKNLFIVVPNNFDLKLEIDGTFNDKTALTSKNYAEYKKIANNKKIIMLDGTKRNYEFLRQVFEYERFEGVKKHDVENIQEFEQLFQDKIVRKTKKV